MLIQDKINNLQIFPIVGFRASLQIKCFNKWRKYKCIIKDLIEILVFRNRRYIFKNKQQKIVKLFKMY